MKTLIYQAKHNTYINMDGKFMNVKKGVMTEISAEIVKQRVPTFQWRDAGEHDTFESAWQNELEYRAAANVERKIETGKMMERVELMRAEENEKL